VPSRAWAARARPRSPAFIEPALFLLAGTALIGTGQTSFAGLVGHWQAAPGFGWLVVPVVLVLFVLLQAEAARVPVDDPLTHLELTMIHEVMVLDHSGPELAAMQYAAALKMTIYAGLIAALLNPFDVQADPLMATAAAVLLMAGGGRGRGLRRVAGGAAAHAHVPPYLMLATALAALALVLAGSWRGRHDGGAAAVPGGGRGAGLLRPCAGGAEVAGGAGLALGWITRGAARIAVLACAGRRHRGAGRARADHAAGWLRRAIQRRAEPNFDLMPSNLFAWAIAIALLVLAFEFGAPAMSEQHALTLGVVAATAAVALLLLASNDAPPAQLVALLFMENAIGLFETLLPHPWPLPVHGALSAIYLLTIGVGSWLIGAPDGEPVAAVDARDGLPRWTRDGLAASDGDRPVDPAPAGAACTGQFPPGLGPALVAAAVLAVLGTFTVFMRVPLAEMPLYGRTAASCSTPPRCCSCWSSTRCSWASACTCRRASARRKVLARNLLPRAGLTLAFMVAMNLGVMANNLLLLWAFIELTTAVRRRWWRRAKPGRRGASPGSTCCTPACRCDHASWASCA
jgi:hypothetical protein